MAKIEKISVDDKDYFFMKSKKDGHYDYTYTGKKPPAKERLKDLKRIIKDHRNVIPLLQEIQSKHEYLPEEEIVRIAKEQDIPATDIMSVATFYSQFKFERPAKYKIQVCDGTACHVRGSVGILRFLEQELNIKPGETTQDGVFAIEVVRCLGLCASAPLMMINEKLHPKLTAESTKEIIRKLREEAKE